MLDDNGFGRRVGDVVQLGGSRGKKPLFNKTIVGTTAQRLPALKRYLDLMSRLLGRHVEVGVAMPEGGRRVEQ
jgi:hypothetical protein